MDKHEFNLNIRANGTWYFYTTLVNLENTGILYVYNYVNQLSKFLDEKVFQTDHVCYYLNSGEYDFKDIARVIDGGGFDDDFKAVVGSIYLKAQECVDKYHDKKSEDEFEYHDIKTMKRLIYSVREELYYQDMEHIETYYKILQLLESKEQFKKL